MCSTFHPFLQLAHSRLPSSFRTVRSRRRERCSAKLGRSSGTSEMACSKSPTCSLERGNPSRAKPLRSAGVRLL